MLAVVGDLLEDIVVRIPHAPRHGTDTPATIRRGRGGSAANVAAAAAGAAGPGRVRFIGRVGDDGLGERLTAELAATGVDVRVQRHGTTGAVVVLVDPSGERTMLPDRAAAAELDAVDPAWLDSVTWLHLPAYSLVAEPSGTACRQLVDAWRPAGGRLSIDVSSVDAVERYGTARFAALLDELAPDVVFANEPESALLSDGPWLAVVKRGPAPVELRGPDGVEVVPVPSLGAVADTTGAGDAFAAGFLVAALDGAAARDAARAGIATAQRVLRGAGTGAAHGSTARQ